MRASHQARERTVSVLGRGCAEGYLSTDTFILRVDVALRAKTVAELRAVLADLPLGRGFWSRVAALLRVAHTPALEPNRPVAAELSRAVGVDVSIADGESVTIGRSRECDVVVADLTVSRLHALLTRDQDRWTVLDLASTNGTWVNGTRVGKALIEAGDILDLGSLRASLH